MSSYILKGNSSPPTHRYGGPFPSSSELRYRSNEALDSSSMFANNQRPDWPELPSSSQTNDAIAVTSLGVAKFLNNVVSHPCIVLRRQCQVHAFAKKLHLTPFTFIPVATHIVTKDGVKTLWKGSIGVGVLWGLSQITEIVLADVCGWPRYVVKEGSPQRFWKHIWLKALTALATTPFIISSFIETVRSGVGSYLSDVGVFDIIFRGIDRLRYDIFGTKDIGRRFSVLYLAAPTVSYFTLHYIIARYSYDWIFNMARRYVSKKPTADRTRFHAIMPEMFATITSPLAADLLLYPFETILHRLYIQGTRTLIDNLDTGYSAMNLTMKYNGFVHCFQSIVKHEGPAALYSGVGAVMLQCALQLVVIWSLRSLMNYGSKRALHVNPSQDLRSGPSSGVLAGPPSAQFSQIAADQNMAGTSTSISTSAYTSPSRSNFSFPTFAQTQQQQTDKNGPSFFDSSSPPKFDNYLLQPSNRFDKDF